MSNSLNLGIVSIKWYSIIMLISVIIGIYLIKKESKKFNINQDFVFNLIFWVIISGIIGARVYYVLFNLNYYLSDPIEILKIWNGGIAIHGAIIGGIIALLIYCKKYKVSIKKITDIFVPALLLGQTIGRWGNFFNQEAHGSITTFTKLKNLKLPGFIIEGMNKNGIYYEPTFLYESIWDLIGFIILIVLRRTKYIKTGILTSIYLIWYGIGRFFIEELRTDSLMLGDIKFAQVVSIIFIVLGNIIFIFNFKGSKFDNLYNDKETKKIKF